MKKSRVRRITILKKLLTMTHLKPSKQTSSIARCHSAGSSSKITTNPTSYKVKLQLALKTFLRPPLVSLSPIAVDKAVHTVPMTISCYRRITTQQEQLKTTISSALSSSAPSRTTSCWRKTTICLTLRTQRMSQTSTPRQSSLQRR